MVNAENEPIIVVGGGLAGLSASLEVITNGGRVVLIEGEKSTGGNSAKASSGINGAGTLTQIALGLDDSPQNLVTDTLSAGDNENNERLVEILARDSAEAVEFLKNVGVDLTDVNLCGGHSVARTHWIPSPKEGRPIPAGFEIMKRLRAKLDEIQGQDAQLFRLFASTKMTRIVKSETTGKVTGVEVENVDGERRIVEGKSLVLATGGFSSDRAPDGLLVEFGGEQLEFPSTNGPFAKGDGVKMARAIGAKLVGMSRIQIHPTAFVDPKDPTSTTKFLAAEALRGKGALLINARGERFGNELGRRDYMTRRILEKSQVIGEHFQNGSGQRKSAIMLMNERNVEAFGRPAFNFYAIVKKFFVKYENADQLADALQADRKTIRTTLEQYEKSFNGQLEDPFGKTVFPIAPILADEPIYAAIITPAIHYTMGGLEIDEQARVISSSDEKPIDGLYAAGEVTGGVHGSNRLAGNSLLECVVFGRIAGRSALRNVEHFDKLEL